MGMFDTVNFTCPSCGDKMSTQSKAGECLLLEYSNSKVPVEIAADIDDEIIHCDCGAEYKLVSSVPKTTKVHLLVL